MKLRLFTIYARKRGSGFSTEWADYYNGTHLWVYKIFAVSVPQACCAAVHEHFAAGPRRSGIRRIQFAYWHRDRVMPEPGDVVLAPYLCRTNDVLVPNHSKEGSP